MRGLRDTGLVSVCCVCVCAKEIEAIHRWAEKRRWGKEGGVDKFQGGDEKTQVTIVIDAGVMVKSRLTFYFSLL